jgi:methionine-rich copper-binding protein CopC
MRTKKTLFDKYKYSFVATLLALLGISLFSSCKEDYDYTVDAANPTVVSFNPVSGTEDISASANLVLTFNEYIQKGSGTVTIASAIDTQTIDVTADEVTISSDKRVLTIDPDDLTASENYTVTIDPGFVTDLLGNKYMGQDSTWTFKTRKQNSLFVSSYSPETGSTNASLFKFSLTFSDSIAKATSGNITVYTTDGDEKVAEVAITSSKVTIQGKKMTLLLEDLLDFATSYYVTLDAGAVLDTDGNEFEGFSGNSTWSFTTTSGSATSLVAYLPFDEDLSDKSGNKFDATLGSNASADVEIVSDATRGYVAQFNAGSYAVLPKHDLLRPSATQDFSVNIWVKLAGVGSDPVLWGNKDWDSGSNAGILLCTNGGNTYVASDATTSGSGWIINMNGNGTGSTRVDWKAKETTTRAPSISDNQWHMVTVVVDRTNQALHAYCDGVEYVYSSGKSLSAIIGGLYDSTNDYPFTLWEDGTGVYNSSSDTRKAMAGMMDELRIYNKALTADEVASLYRY